MEYTKEEIDSRILQLENSLSFRKRLMRNRDPLREEEKIVRAKEAGKPYVDHLKEDINLIEWTIKYIQSTSS